MTDPFRLAVERYALPIIFFLIFIGLLVFGSAGGQYLAFMLLILFIALYTSIFVHELGHLIAGWRVGYRFVLFSVGMLHIYNDKGRPRAIFLRLPGVPPSYLGFTLFMIDDFNEFRRRMTWYIMAGPLATALLVLVTGALYATTRGLGEYALYESMPITWALATFNNFLFWISVVLLVMALTPAEWVSTDGHKLLRLLRGGAILERFKAQTQVNSAVMQGIRPRDWDRQWIETMTVLKDDSADVVNAYTMAYRWALDRQDEKQAEAYLTIAIKLRGKVSPLDRINLLMEAAYIEVRYHANADNASQWLQRIGSQENRARPLLRMRVTCASDLVKRDYEQARKNALQGIWALNRSRATDGLSVMERDLFHDIIRLCDLADEMNAKRTGT